MPSEQKSMPAKSSGTDNHLVHELQPNIRTSSVVYVKVRDTSAEQKMLRTKENTIMAETSNVEKAQVTIPTVLQIQVKNTPQKPLASNTTKDKLTTHSYPTYALQRATTEVLIHNSVPPTARTNNIAFSASTSSSSKETSASYAKKLQETITIMPINSSSEVKELFQKKEFQLRNSKHKAKDNSVSKHLLKVEQLPKDKNTGKLNSVLRHVKKNAKKISKRIEKLVRQKTHRAGAMMKTAITLAICAVGFAVGVAIGNEWLIDMSSLVAIMIVGFFVIVVAIVSIPPIILLTIVGIPFTSPLGLAFIGISDLFLLGWVSDAKGKISGGDGGSVFWYPEEGKF